MTTDPDAIVTASELAKLLRVSESHIWHQIVAGRITKADGMIRYGRKMTRFHRETALRRFISGEFGRGMD
jgi:hypothetical protein